MSTEIERKFLVTSDTFKNMAIDKHHIRQGYICRDKEHTVRVRIKDEQGYITVKGQTTGISRCEWEYSIPKADALDMLEKVCIPPVIEKHRYIVPFGNKMWEVDEFYGFLKGLVIAEVELENEDESIGFPPFVGKEVSDDPRYFNSNLHKLTGDLLKR